MTVLNPRVILVCVGIIIAVAAAASLRYFSQSQTLPGFSNGGGLSGAGQLALEADDVQVVGRSGGAVHWRMAARAVTLSRDRQVITVSGIRRGALYAAGGRPSALLTADQASYTTPFGVLGFSGMGALRVEGHVQAQVLTPEHPNLRTEQIVWDSASNELSCPAAVIATLPKLTVTAGNAAYSSPPGAPARGVMRLGGGVHAAFSSTRGTATLACPGLVWPAETQSARTTGPVTAQIPGGLGTATAADMEVNTRTGDLSGHGFQGTLRLSREVQ